MSQDPGPLWGLLVVLGVLILIVAFLSAASTAMESANRNNIRNLAQEGNTKAQAMLNVAHDSYKYIINIQVSVVCLTLVMSSVTGYYIGEKLGVVFKDAGLPFYQILAVIIYTLVLSFVVLLLGIVFPKRLALLHADSMAMKTYGKAKVLILIFKPLAVIINAGVILLLKICRQRTDVTEAIYSEDEVVSMLESGQESGALKEEGMKMITSIFAFDDRLAYEIMTPRTDVFAIDLDEPSEEYIDELMELRYSRIPVYEDDSDNIIGILYIKDYLIKAREAGFDNVDIRSILRKPYLVPETKKIDTLFVELQSTKQHIAILIDEYGGFSGIVTMEDIIEEVMGDIDDEYDEVEPEIQKVSDNVFIVDGSMYLDDIDEELGINLESDNSETIGGLIIDILGEIPDDDDLGQIVSYKNYDFRIDSIRDRRIEQITVTIKPDEIVEMDEDSN